jgi:hypothetical protein
MQQEKHVSQVRENKSLSNVKLCVLPQYTFSLKFLQFLGAFAELRKATIGFVLSGCPSVRMEQIGFH